MSKNDFKNRNFLKIDDVVFLSNAVNKKMETKGGNTSQTPQRRSLSRPSSASCTTKFQAIQPRITSESPASPKPSPAPVQVMHTMSNPINVPVVAVTAFCNLPTSSQCDGEVKNSVFTLSSPQQEIVVRRKPNLNRSPAGQRRGPRQRLVLSTESSAHLSYSQKPESTSNGQSNLDRTPSNIRPTTTIIGSGVTITPIVGSRIIQKANNIIARPPPAKVGDTIICSRCSNVTKYTDKCEHCHQEFVAAPSRTVSKHADLKSKDAVTQISSQNAVPINSAIFTKEAFYGNKVQDTQQTTTQCIRQNSGTKVIVRELPNINPNPTRGRPKGSRNRVQEPVCLTISSDDEEPMDEGNANEVSSANNSPLLLRQQPPRAVAIASHQQRQFTNLRMIDRSGKKCVIHVRDGESNKLLQSLPITDDDEEEMEDEEEELVEDEEDMRSNSEEMNTSSEGNEKEQIEVLSPHGQLVIQCRSIRIGSYKIHPRSPSSYVPIFVGNTTYTFQVPSLKNCADMHKITLEENDICKIFAHLGRCLPIMFISVNQSCAERIRKQIGMVKHETVYFDPDVSEPKQKFITFLIELMDEELRTFIRNMFSTTIIQEVDQKTANEILVKSTPNQPAPPPPSQPQAVIIKTIPVTVQSNIPLPSPSPATVKKILTYPPPPQTGGIEITSDDVACLADEEFLNDAIIDFYLKYLMQEKLSAEDRARTHIFNSFFYPRLTQKPLTRVKNEESSMSVKRHMQVRSWTKNIDIFTKDFIIIPINQNMHWFLAIICNPGQVPEMSESVSSKCAASQKLASENVSSSNDQESCSSPTASCSNLSMDNELGSVSVTTKDQACGTEDQSSNESSNAYGSCYSNEAESSYTEDSINETPDSTTNPDRNIPNTKSPCILIFDSLPGPSRNRIINTLREYLEIEWRMRKNTHRAFNKITMQGYSPNVPQQSNFSDCGVYVLQYVESFFENPLPYYANTISELADWFPPEKIANKRKEIKNLIDELERRQSAAATSSNTSERSTNAKQNAENKSTPSPTISIHQKT